jgi:hypothetical protein
VILVVQAYIGSRTSALMSTAQQIAMSVGESYSISVPVPLGDAMIEQAETCRERSLVTLGTTLCENVRVKSVGQ